MTLFGGRGSVEWARVGNVRWSAGMKWFVVSVAPSKSIRLSAMLAGLPSFAAAVLQRVPWERIDPAAIPVLQKTAAGRVPPLW